MKLGVSQKDITPEIGCYLYGYSDDVIAESVHDRLDVTAFYFESPRGKMLLVSATLGTFQTALSNRIRTKLAAECDVPYENIILCATHTHTAPNTTGTYGWGNLDLPYCEQILIPQISAAAQEAVASAVPAKMGYATGNSLVGINRREMNANGAEGNRCFLGQNEWGCFNPKMSVLSFRDRAGKPIANLIHYGCHGTAASRARQISRDWPGVMTDCLARETGAVTAFFNGPEGDVGPRLTNGRTSGNREINGVNYGNMQYVEELGGVAAADAIRIFRTIPFYRDFDIDFFNGKLSLALKKRLSREEAEAGYKKYAEFSVNHNGQKKNYYRNLLDSYEQGYVDAPALEIDQTVFRIGDIVFAPFPYEVFSEIGLRIQKISSFYHVLSLSNANGCEGYFVTEDSLCRGGYEIEMFLTGRLQPFEQDADWNLIRETVNNIRHLEENA